MPMTPQQVTAFFAQVGDELEALEAARAEVQQLQDEMRRLREERDELAARLAGMDESRVAVGAEVENVLRAARELADDVQERARCKAAELVAEAAEAAAAAMAASTRLRTGAELEAAEIISQAWRQSADHVARQVSWYEELLLAERATSRHQEEDPWETLGMSDASGPTPSLEPEGATDPAASASDPSSQLTCSDSDRFRHDLLPAAQVAAHTRR